MSDSLLRDPAQWAGMTYLEVLQMLLLATVERGYASPQGDSFNYYTTTSKYTYGTLLTLICGNLKRLLNDFGDGGSLLIQI